MYRNHPLPIAIDRSAHDDGHPANPWKGLVGYYESFGGLAVKHAVFEEWLAD
jgi:hypothetical protein